MIVFEKLKSEGIVACLYWIKSHAEDSEVDQIRELIDEIKPINPHSLELHKRHKYSQAFEEFWLAFPSVRKTKKPQAADLFKTLEPLDQDAIIEAAKEFAASAEGQSKYCPGPVPWLNAKRWEDDREAWNMGGKDDAPVTFAAQKNQNIATANAEWMPDFTAIGTEQRRIENG